MFAALADDVGKRVAGVERREDSSQTTVAKVRIHP